MADKDIFDEIKSILDQNGSITQNTKDRIMLMSIMQLHSEVQNVAEEVECLKDMSKRMDVLERNSIVMWVNHHPKMAVTVLVLSLLLLDFYFNGGMKGSILKILGF